NFLKTAKKKNKKNINKETYWTSINIYITNISVETIGKEELHDVKRVKLERFQCFLYSRLTALLLTSSIVSTGKKIAYEETVK
ncbi:MAG: IS4 family transposase, partial [Clostridium sp.]